MGLRFTRGIGRRVRLALALFALLAAALAAIIAPLFALPAIIVAALLVLWDGVALAADLRALAAAVAAVVPLGDASAMRKADPQRLYDAKLEVAEGAWGELCHALNRLLQQRRAEQRLRHLLPALPGSGTARLSELTVTPEGLPCELVVLAMVQPAAALDPIASLRDSAYLALHQSQLHDALLVRWGEGILLIFGVLGQQDGPAALRGAHHAARAMVAMWSASPPGQRPRLILAVGHGRAVILPGLGLSVVGAPVEQALALRDLADDDTLVCNEEAYLGLRRLGVTPARPAARLPAAVGRPPAFAVPLESK